jgi:hypothetical protein
MKRESGAAARTFTLPRAVLRTVALAQNAGSSVGVDDFTLGRRNRWPRRCVTRINAALDGPVLQ